MVINLNKLDYIKESLGIIRDFFKPVEPLASATVICSKALWKGQKTRQLRREIQSLKKRIHILQKIDRPGADKKIAILRQELKAKKEEKLHSRLSFLRLGSLFFSNPGSNLWNSATSLADHALSFHRHLKSPAIHKIALNSLSVFAVGLSFLQQTGALEENDLFCQGVIKASLFSQCIDVASGWARRIF